MRKYFIALALLTTGAAAQAADLGIALSDNTVVLDYTGRARDKSLDFTLDWLHHTDNGDVVSGGVQVSQNLDKNLNVAVGLKAVGVFNDYDNASALALGGRIDLAVPAAPRLHFIMNGWIAPGVVSFSGARSYQDFGAALSYQVIDNASVFVGYRYAKVKYDDLKTGIEMQDGALIGLRMNF